MSRRLWHARRRDENNLQCVGEPACETPPALGNTGDDKDVDCPACLAILWSDLSRHHRHSDGVARTESTEGRPRPVAARLGSASRTARARLRAHVLARSAFHDYARGLLGALNARGCLLCDLRRGPASAQDKNKHGRRRNHAQKADNGGNAGRAGARALGRSWSGIDAAAANRRRGESRRRAGELRARRRRASKGRHGYHDVEA